MGASKSVKPAAAGTANRLLRRARSGPRKLLANNSKSISQDVSRLDLFEPVGEGALRVLVRIIEEGRR